MSMMFGIGVSSWANIRSVTIESKNTTSVKFKITLDATSKGITFVNYRTMDGSAISGSHYEVKSGSAVIEKGSDHVFVEVPLLEASGIETYGKEGTKREFGLDAWDENSSKSAWVQIDNKKSYSYKAGERSLDMIKTQPYTYHLLKNPFDNYSTNPELNSRVCKAGKTGNCSGDWNVYFQSGGDADYAKHDVSLESIISQDEVDYLNFTDQNYFYAARFSYHISGDEYYRFCASVKGSCFGDINDSKYGSSMLFSIYEKTKSHDVSEPHTGTGNWHEGDSEKLTIGGEEHLYLKFAKMDTVPMWYTTWEGKDGSDGCWFNSFILNVIVRDTIAPRILEVRCNNEGVYYYGDSISVALRFNEIVELVNPESSYTIETSLGTLYYQGGAGSNVLYFTGKLNASDNETSLKVKTFKLDAKDLAGNSVSFGVTNPKLNAIPCYYQGNDMSSVKATPSIFDGKIKLSWEMPRNDNSKGNCEIYRRAETDTTWTKVGSLSGAEWTDQTSTTDSSSILYNENYIYLVQFVPDNFINKKPNCDVRNTVSAKLDNSQFKMTIEKTDKDKSIGLKWSANPPLPTNYKYSLCRNDSNIRTITADQDLQFEDKEVPNSCQKYTYTVKTPALFKDWENKKGTIYSATCEGQMSGVTKFIKVSDYETNKLKIEETQSGDRPALKLSWKVDQVGIENTKFEISRDGSILVESTTNLEYTDTTITKGVKYDYKVKIVSCSGKDSTISANGIYKAIGTISGTITYSSGTAVKGVTVTIEDVTDTSKVRQVKTVETNDNGFFEVKDVPYIGTGSTFKVIPSLGTHKFECNGIGNGFANCVLNGNVWTVSGVNFTDISSFKFKGNVKYLNTNIGVDSVKILVDGFVNTVDGKEVLSDENGNFVAEIGNGVHKITVSRDGHTFCNGGKYIDAKTKSESIDVFSDMGMSADPIGFVDSTFVTLTGRVAGGSEQAKVKYGMGAGKANIGKATIILSVNEKWSLNVTNSSCTYRNSLMTGECSAKTDVGEGNKNKIEITTDSTTGEFAVDLLPLQYTVEKVSVKNGLFEDRKKTLIDLGSTTKLMRPKTDTLVKNNGDTCVFHYIDSLSLIYYADPTMEVIPLYNDVNAYGERTYVYKEDELDSKNDTVILYEKTNEGINYLYGYPVFKQMSSYSNTIRAYELYVNEDNPLKIQYDTIPLAGVALTIVNDMAAKSVCNAKEEPEGGYDEKQIAESGLTAEIIDSLEVGDIVESDTTAMRLDSAGVMKYTFMASFPNISTPYTLGMNIYYKYKGKDYQWRKDPLKGIVLGGLSYGNDFVTAGPSEILYILRDPAGSGSFAYMEEGVTYTETKHFSYGGSTETGIKTVSHLGTNMTEIFGFTYVMETNTKIDITVGAELNVSYLDEDTRVTSTTTTSKISTSSEPSYVGEDGDVYIGASTNIIIGKVRNVGLYKNAVGGYDLDMRDELGMGQQYPTMFKYSQSHVENALIPELYSLIKSGGILKTVSPEEYEEIFAEVNGRKGRKYCGKYLNDSRKPLYVTSLSADDERFGSANTDKSVWGNNASTTPTIGPSYIMLVPDTIHSYSDTILWIKDQIATWEKVIENNEKEKVKAIENDTPKENVSWDAGTHVESSIESCDGHTDAQTLHHEEYIVLGGETGFEVNFTGVDVSVDEKAGSAQEEHWEYEWNTCTTVGYELHDEGTDYLSVDVYDAGDGYGPIFYTRGGRTSCPYEDEKKTRYFEPGQHVLAEKTIQIEYPQLSVNGMSSSQLSNLPNGSAAKFELKLDNLSGSEDNIYYKLYVVDQTNPNGAALSIDGDPLTTSRDILINYGEPTIKTLQLIQSRLDVIEYDSIAVVLASRCQYDGTDNWEVIADTVYLTAHFVPSCSPISMSVDNSVLNTGTHDTLQVKVFDYEREFLNFESVNVEYKGIHDEEWTVCAELDTSKLNDANVRISIPMKSQNFSDQTYLFRAVSVCKRGTDLTTLESKSVEVIKDMEKPLVLGNPNPSDGVLDAGDEISVTFNEDIRTGLILKDENFVVQGVTNEAKVEHNVALKMDGSSYAAMTESGIVLSKKNFSIDMWMNLTSGGELLSIDPYGNPFTVLVKDNGALCVKNGNDSIVSNAIVPFGQWCFMTLSVDAGSSTVNASVAYGDQDKSFSGNLKPFECSGKICVGKNITGAISELSIWNTNRSVAEAKSEMYSVKSPSTEHLVGYWKFDEGHGLVANDLARNRNMNLANETWYMNNENYAAHLNGTSKLSVDISNAPALNSDNYMVELWFRGEQQQKATLWSADTMVALMFDKSGYLTLITNNVETQLSTNNYLDGAWHHVALNVLRNGMTTVYVDGVAVKQISSEKVPALQSAQLTIGAQHFFNTSLDRFDSKSYFVGDVDEVRYWVATFNAKTIEDFRYMRLNGDESGLRAYCPFEEEVKDNYSQQVYSQFTLKNLCNEKNVDGDAEEAKTAPSLHQRPAMSNLAYSFTASERTIVITLNEKPQRLEGTTVYVTVKNLKDLNNNVSNVITWSAYINQNRLVWSDEEIAIEKDDETSSSFEVSVVNQGAATESWSISGLPSWLSASKSSGSLAAKKNEKISFEISDATPVGTYEESIYLTGNDEISVPLTLIVKVTANKPNWNVDPSQYKNSMSVLAQLKVDGKYSSDEDDMVAAFINGVCVGVASPVYYPRYDAYFVSLGVYGNDAEVNKNITFKAWDASTGVIYPSLSTSTPISFEANKVFGSMTKPILFETKDLQEQMFDLRKGWNWISLNVKPEDENINEVFNSVADETNLLKSKLQVAYSDEDSLVGTLETAEIGVMYKINMDNDAVLSLVGSPVDPDKDSVSVKTGWNWIGFNSTSNMSLGTAFADLDPVDGDMVKSQTAFAMYEDFEWVGTLTSLTPGKGYMYKSAANKDRSFAYPAKASSLRMASMKAAPKTPTLYTPVDETAYSGNMTIAAVVKENGEIIPNAQVGVFDANGVCRGAGATGYKSTVFLVVLGESSKDALTFKVMVNGFEYTVDQALSFEEDANYGTLQDPYVIDLGSGEITKLDFENDNLTSVSVCPTFVETELNVKSQTAEIENYTINDITGKLIMNVDVNSSDFTINVSDLSQGVYLINLKTSMGIVVKQFTKK